MCSESEGATLVYRCRCAASAIFSYGSRGTPGWANTLNRVPELPNAQDGSSIVCSRRTLLTASRSMLLTSLVICPITPEEPDVPRPECKRLARSVPLPAEHFSHRRGRRSLRLVPAPVMQDV